MTREVVLAHGLWMPAAAMMPFKALLARLGYRVQVFSYSGRKPLEPSAERLARFALERFGERPAHFIGHSLGGVLVLRALNGHPEVAIASALLLGAPVRGCAAGRRLAKSAAGGWLLGASACLWTERDAQWQRNEPLGVIAGTLPVGLGWLTGKVPGASDGVVRVEETTVRGMRARALVPLGHSMLVASPRVARLADSFFREGSFE